MSTLDADELVRALAPGPPACATELYMSAATVKAHVSRLMTKLRVENRVQSAVLVQEAQRA